MEKTALTIFDSEKIRYENALKQSVNFTDIKTVEQAQKAKEFAVGISKFIKLVDAKRKETTKSEREEIKRVDDYVKENIDIKKLDEVSKRIMAAVVNFDQMQKIKQNAKQIDNVSDRLESMKQGLTIQTKHDNIIPIVKTRDNWVAKLVDFNQVDEKHKTVNWDSVNADIKAGVRELNGFVIKNEPIPIRR